MKKEVSFEEAIEGLMKIKKDLENKLILSNYDNDYLIDIYLTEKSRIPEKVISLYKELSPEYKPSLFDIYEKNKSNGMYDEGVDDEDIEYEEIGKAHAGKNPLEIKLTPWEGYLINTRTQEEYDILMQLYEKAGWKSGEDHFLPTDTDVWKDNKENTCVDAGYVLSEGRGFFLFADLKKLEDTSKVKNAWDFVYEQKIDIRKKIDRLNQWYNSNKPKRKSRGTFKNRFLYGDLRGYVPESLRKIFNK